MGLRVGILNTGLEFLKMQITRRSALNIREEAEIVRRRKLIWSTNHALSGFGFAPFIPYSEIAFAASLAVSLPSAANAATAACAT